MDIGNRIKQRRLTLNLTADDLADKIGKSRATIYRYENGDIENMPTTVLEPLAEALYTTPAYLMGWTDDPCDYEQIGNDAGIVMPKGCEGSYEQIVKSKLAANDDHYREESELIQKVLYDAQFNQLACDYARLNDIGKRKACEYVSDLSEQSKYTNERFTDNKKPYLMPVAAHERTDVEVTDEMRKHDNELMDNDDIWE